MSRRHEFDLRLNILTFHISLAVVKVGHWTMPHLTSEEEHVVRFAQLTKIKALRHGTT